MPAMDAEMDIKSKKESFSSMIAFYTPKLADKPWVDKLLLGADSRGCEYSFTNLYTWRHAFHYAVAPVEGFLAARLCGALGCSYLYPAGEGDVERVLRALAEDAGERGEPFRLVCLSGEQAAGLEVRFPGCFQIEADRDSFDYLYEIDRLADLPGKRLHAKRNHINAFTRAFPDWTYEEMTPAVLPECLEMDKEWYRRSREREGAAQAGDLGNEGLALRDAIAHFEELGLEGGVIRVYGEVVAFTMGDRLGRDCYDVRFEKAYNELRGGYTLINREFARWVRKRYPQVRYLNREDDMGVPGLRKAKESYYPDRMVEKYSAILKKDAVL